jgi:autotransporter-associated beta strand protein
MQNPIKFLAAALCLFITFIATPGMATYWCWDPEGTTVQSTAPGTWDTTSAQWSTSTALTGSPVAWGSGGIAALFCAGSVTGTFTVTVNTNIPNCGGIFNGTLAPPGCFVTLSGTGSISLAAGADAFSTGGSDGGTTTINIPLTGPGQVALEAGDQIFFNATNTYTGGTTLGYPGQTPFIGIVNFTGTILHVTSGCAMVAEGTSAINIPNTFYPTNGNLNLVGNAAGVTFSGPWNVGANAFNIGSGGVAGNLIILSSVVSGSGSFNKYNPGILRLSGTNTYTGSIIVSNGTLALAATGSINSASKLTILPGAIFDTSAISSYTLGGSTTLLAAGTGTASTTYAEINGASGGTVSLGSRPVILNFSPTSGNSDTTHPSLYVSQGTLKFSNNTITITNLSTNTLHAGTYRLIQVGNGTSGSISGTPSPSFSLQGTGIAAGYAGALVVSNGNLNLVVKAGPTFSGLASTDASAIGVGVTSVTLTGTMAATGPVYPANGENLSVKINGASLNATFTNTIGNFATTFNITNIPYTSNSYPLILTYSGNASIAAVTNNTTLVTNGFFYGGALPGFFSGMNLFVTNTSGLSMYTWSTTNPGLPVIFWDLEGPMQEQPLGSTGQSRYTITVNPPTSSQVFYICGTTLNWPYSSPTAAQWLITDDSGNSLWYPTNVSITQEGVLNIPAAPVILQSPSNVTVLAGKTATFNAAVTGSAPLSYQWYFNSNPAGGLTNFPLVLTNVTAGMAGNYSVLVSNANGTAQSAAATLQVLPPPQLTVQQRANGSLQWSGYALPGENYLVQRNTNIATSNWVTIASNTADTNGLVQFIVPGTLAPSNAFYRLVFP